MHQTFTSNHDYDLGGNPSGGYASGVGFSISWQRGPLGNPDGTRNEPNGAFVETLLDVVKDRLEFYQGVGEYMVPGCGKFRCQENADAIKAIEEALQFLNKRTHNREVRGVEGTNVV